MNGAAADPAGAGTAAPGLDRAGRLFLAHRRHELLAQVAALRELAAQLLRTDAVQCRPQAAGNVETIVNAVGRFSALVESVLDPERLDGGPACVEETARALNHDLRTPLAVVVSYGDDLRRLARKSGVDELAPDLEQLRTVARRALALVDNAVVRLRDSEASADADGASLLLNRAAATAGAADDGDVLAAEPGSLLVVEDDDALRGLLGDLLRSQGHQVATARDGVEALALLGSRAFDLVLTDIEMPRADGYQLLERLKAEPALRDVPVIVVSSHVELDGIVRCIKAGADDYLPKPFNRVLLKARVDACLEKKRLRDRHEQQRRRYDQLLHAILPHPVVAELELSDAFKPRHRDGVAILFADLVGFTPFSDRYRDRPDLVVGYLRRVFEGWEQIASGFGVQKIKTMGDAMMAVSGLLEHVDHPADDCVRCGLQMIEFTQGVRDEHGQPIGWDLRVGVHVGSVVAGVLGRRQYLFDLWGDAVNVAARLESHGRHGAVNLSVEAWETLAGRYPNVDRSTCAIKGKPVPMEVVHITAASVALN